MFLFLTPLAAQAALTCEEIIHDLDRNYPERAILQNLWSHPPEIDEVYLSCLEAGNVPAEILLAARRLYQRQRAPSGEEDTIVLEGADLLRQVAHTIAQAAQNQSNNWELKFAVHLDCEGLEAAVMTGDWSVRPGTSTPPPLSTPPDLVSHRRILPLASKEPPGRLPVHRRR